jgi:hypothetical protein
VPYNNIISRGDTAGGQAMTEKKPSAKADAGREQVQSKMDEITAQGFRGVKVDPTPNENYTVAGVTAGAPTPETDVEAEAAVSDTLTPGPLAAAEAEAKRVEDASN